VRCVTYKVRLTNLVFTRAFPRKEWITAYIQFTGKTFLSGSCYTDLGPHWTSKAFAEWALGSGTRAADWECVGFLTALAR
jgi:hypothetical protein